MEEFSKYAPGLFFTTLCILALTEATKRCVRFVYLKKYEVQTQTKATGPDGQNIRMYPGVWARVWHELVLPATPAVWGMALACVGSDFLWGALELWPRLVVGFVLGSFNAFFVRLVLLVIPNRYGVNVPLPDDVRHVTRYSVPPPQE